MAVFFFFILLCGSAAFTSLHTASSSCSSSSTITLLRFSTELTSFFDDRLQNVSGSSSSSHSHILILSLQLWLLFLVRSYDFHYELQNLTSPPALITMLLLSSIFQLLSCFSTFFSIFSVLLVPSLLVNNLLHHRDFTVLLAAAGKCQVSLMTLTVLLGSVSVFALSLTEPHTTVEQNLVSVINHTCASPAVTSRNVSRETNILRAEQKSQTRRAFSPELLFSWKSWKVWCVLVESRVCSALFLWAWDSYIRQVEQAVCVQVRMSAAGRFRHTGSSRVLLGSGGVCCTSRQYLRGPELQWRVILRVLVLTSVLWTRFNFTWQQNHVESCCTATSPEVTCGRRAAL